VTVWVYIDQDHNDVELFATQELAKAYAEECWPDVAQEEGWDGNSLGEYVRVVPRMVRTK
jgi:predicted nucleotidyltransferase